jgi:AAA domain/Bifunctional DNA primase/polymerase, N-terminal
MESIGMAASPEVIAAAEYFLAQGYHIVAVRADKRPWGKDWRRVHSRDEVIKLLKGPNCPAIGFLGGELNGSIVALDFDNFKGEAWFRESCKQAGLDPFAYPIVITPGKIAPDGSRFPGRHRYMRDTRGTLGNSAGSLALVGIDVRGKGHTMLPPSPHPDGGTYIWLAEHEFADFPDGPPPVPDFVYQAIAETPEAAMARAAAENPDIPEYSAPFIAPALPPRANGPDPVAMAAGSPAARYAAYARAALEAAAKRLAGALAGNRNNSLNNEALGLGHLALLGGFQESEAFSTLMAACEANGLIAADGIKSVHATFWSGWRKGLSEPQLPPERPFGPEQPKPRETPRKPADGGGDAAGFADYSAEDTNYSGRQEGAALPLYTPEAWANRDIPPADFLLGDLFSTTSRVIIGGPTGLGKTQLALFMAFAMAAGSAFLHWSARRPARVLYLDGEMSRRLAKERIVSAIARFGSAPDGLIFINKEDFENMPPLNSEEGQAYVDDLIRQYGPFDFLIIDNIQAWCPGDLKSPESWALVLPWIRALTRRGIGQLWIHHTGHETDRLYGDKSREWQLDTVALMSKPEEEPAPERLIEFRLDFTKARERTPANRSDFDPVNLWLTEDEGWQSDRGHVLRAYSRRGRPPAAPRASTLDDEFHKGLLPALTSEQAEVDETTTDRPLRYTTIKNWRAACVEAGLIEKDDPSDGKQRARQSAMFSRYKQRLIALGWIKISGDFVASIKEIDDA